jgi:tripartite-type tricarboxylate transporter receptor subunit TctC
MNFLKSVISPLAAVLTAGVLAAGPSSAQGTYPAPGKNITLVLPFAAGSGTDTTTRIISKDLAKALGTSIVIENKPGANGSIAASYVARGAGRLHHLRHHQHVAFGKSVSAEEHDV